MLSLRIEHHISTRRDANSVHSLKHSGVPLVLSITYYIGHVTLARGPLIAVIPYSRAAWHAAMEPAGSVALRTPTYVR